LVAIGWVASTVLEAGGAPVVLDIRLVALEEIPIELLAVYALGAAVPDWLAAVPAAEVADAERDIGTPPICPRDVPPGCPDSRAATSGGRLEVPRAAEVAAAPGGSIVTYTFTVVYTVPPLPPGADTGA
jgi:hypothetical protein